ncbi:hypothetical protein KGM_206296 [Danaus plexippus plexippus]|uniref:Uncharacterized protein n=1 Tax=Danaus plexippus plexippus TaxID=278856 RepID=A0A212F6U7_DANPL|nr:hypothetical protein KGM_206296 [Danaus plexippus plexippus]
MLYVLCFLNIRGEKCNLNVKVEQTLKNIGFHRILNYTISLPSEDEFSKWLYDDCLIGIEQTLPAGLYASPDEVKAHKCKELVG